MRKLRKGDVLMARFTVQTSGGETLTADTLAAARLVGLKATKPGDVFGIEGQTGKGRFYLRKGAVAYEVSAKVAALEMWMHGK